MPRALIIGCGIAGPATAMALQRAGYDATVCDAYGRDSRADAAIYLTIAVNGLDALRSIDAGHLLTANGIPCEETEFFNGNGRRFGAWPMGGTLADGSVAHTIKRGAFCRLLRDEAVRRGICVVDGKRLVEATSTASGEVIAFFDDGTRESADLLVGADGIHSRTRSIIDPRAPQPLYLGVGNTGGFTRYAHVEARPGMSRIYFGRRAVFGYTVGSEGEVWWFAHPRAEREIPYGQLVSMKTSQLKNRLLDLFEHDSSPAVEIILATDHELSLSNAYELPSVPVWHRGAMILIGDAAHAASPAAGQGASMALEDAVELGRCLRDLPRDEAFAAYEQLRRERVGRVAALGAMLSRQTRPGPVGRFARGLVLPMLLKRKLASSPDTNWLYDHHIDWTAEVDAPQRIAV